MAESRRIEEIAEKARADFLRRKSLRFFECSVELMLTDMSIAEVARVLREEANQLEEFE